MATAFAGKVALVTGAGGGIGLATAEAFANAGASVVLADRDEEAIGRAAEGLRAAGHNTIGVAFPESPFDDIFVAQPPIAGEFIWATAAGSAATRRAPARLARVADHKPNS